MVVDPRVGETGPMTADRDPAGRSTALDRSALLELALEASGTGAWRWDPVAEVAVWDTTMEALCGVEAGTFDGTLAAWREVVHPDDRQWVMELLGSALAQTHPFSFTHRMLGADGSVRWLEVRGRGFVDAAGHTVGAVGCAFDVTDRTALEAEREGLIARSNLLLARLDSLQQIGGRLAGASSIDEVGKVVVDELQTTQLGRSRAVWIVDGRDRALELVASHGSSEEVLANFVSIPVDADLPAAVAWRERRIVRSDTPEDARREFPALADAARSTRGFLVVPLVQADRCEGALVVGFDDPAIPELDIAFLRALAGHVAQSVARARWSDAVVERAEVSMARAEYERSRRERVEFLSQLTGSALVAADLDDLLDRITRSAVPRLGDWCAIHFLPEGSSTVHSSIAHVDPGREHRAREIQERFPFSLDRPGGAAEVMRTGRPELLVDIDESTLEQVLVHMDAEDAEELRTIVRELGLVSAISVPLMTRNRVVGLMQFVMAESGRHYEPADLALAEAVAGRVADAARAAWSTDQQRAIANSLQRALLPPGLPDVPGLGVACRYATGDSAIEVGGDFYDLFALGGDRFAFAIGDVCGTGADAAAVTVIARHTIRAAARHGVDPAEVVEWVNQALLEGGRGRFCTVCYGTLERAADGRWVLTSTAAGHPLPVVRRADGSTEQVGRPGTLVGAFTDIDVTVAERVLDPGDVLVLYTDGLTDLPGPAGADADDVEGELAGHGVTRPDAVADGLLDWLRRRTQGGDHSDDVALLVLTVD